MGVSSPNGWNLLDLLASFCVYASSLFDHGGSIIFDHYGVSVDKYLQSSLFSPRLKTSPTQDYQVLFERFP